MTPRGTPSSSHNYDVKTSHHTSHKPQQKRKLTFRRCSGSMLSPQRSYAICTSFSIFYIAKKRNSHVEKQTCPSLAILSLCFDSVWVCLQYGAMKCISFVKWNALVVSKWLVLHSIESHFTSHLCMVVFPLVTIWMIKITSFDIFNLIFWAVKTTYRVFSIVMHNFLVNLGWNTLKVHYTTE